MKLDRLAPFALHLARRSRQVLRAEYTLYALEQRLENPSIDRPFSVVSPDRLSIGANVEIRRNCQFHCGGRSWSGGRGSITVGRNCNFQENVVLYGAGEIEVGDYAGFGPGCMVFSSREDYAAGKEYDESLSHRFGKVVIGPRARINAGVIIGPGVTVGEGAVVGAGAVVLKDVPAWSFVAGVPAKEIGSRASIDPPKRVAGGVSEADAA